MFIDGISIGGFRSFGDPQVFAPMAKVNLIAGQNNSGKSNILRFLADHFTEFIKAAAGHAAGLPLPPLDRHRDGVKPIRFGLALRPHEGPFYEALTALFGPARNGDLEQIITAISENELAWFRFQGSHSEDDGLDVDAGTIKRALQLCPEDVWQRASTKLTRLGHGKPAANVDAVLRSMIARFPIPRIALIPAIRELGAKPVPDSPDYSGMDIVPRLADLESPSILELHKRGRFDSIIRFMRVVLEREDIELSIPYQRDTMHVTIGGDVRRLDYLGTGIHEVAMLASWATILEGYILCIEEPELHLHPILQRKLVRYLSENTANQYLISTHSAHFLDQPAAAIFHVRANEEQSAVDAVVTSFDRVRICADLGYRATDLLQANSIVWVEGPSDRVYIRLWLSMVDPELIEGIHYSIMFYGGRLLSNLSADDHEVDEFIGLRKLNQWLAIVIDSDRSYDGQELNATKVRIRDEFDRGPGFAWVTLGREIENYFSAEILDEAVQVLDPSSARVPNSSIYERAYVAQRPDGRRLNEDKIKLARIVASMSVRLAVLDLETHVLRLASFVRAANGLAPKYSEL